MLDKEGLTPPMSALPPIHATRPDRTEDRWYQGEKMATTTNKSDMMNPRNIAIAVVAVVVLLAIVGWAGVWFGGEAPKEVSAPATTTEQPATTGQGTTTT